MVPNIFDSAARERERCARTIYYSTDTCTHTHTLKGSINNIKWWAIFNLEKLSLYIAMHCGIYNTKIVLLQCNIATYCECLIQSHIHTHQNVAVKLTDWDRELNTLLDRCVCVAIILMQLFHCRKAEALPTQVKAFTLWTNFIILFHFSTWRRTVIGQSIDCWCALKCVDQSVWHLPMADLATARLRWAARSVWLSRFWFTPLALDVS